MDKKISEFKAVTATDSTTQIPLVQGKIEPIQGIGYTKIQELKQIHTI